MISPRGNRFEDFFADDAYVVLKNFLYNYLLRKRAIETCLTGRWEGPDPGNRERSIADGGRIG